MNDNIDVLINKNLNLLSLAAMGEMEEHEFLNEDGIELAYSTSKINDKVLIKHMLKEDLITVSDTTSKITPLGDKIVKKGGWLVELQKRNSQIKKEFKKTELKESLEIDIKLLQKDNFEYLKTIRNQNDRIRNLEEQIKTISLLKLYWWLIPTCIVVGIFLAQIWDLIK